MKNRHGFAHILIIVVFALVLVVIAGVTVYKRVESKGDGSQNDKSSEQAELSENSEQSTADSILKQETEPDSADTLASPEKFTSADTKTYFVYGAPAGQNNKTPKRIIISLPGHGTTADDGYNAWKNHLSTLNGGTYALAEFNWWRGTGEKKEDYYDPPNIVAQVRAFLDQQGYTSSDIVVLHGFSRGSANTYAVVAQDKLKKGSVFDAVISNAGKYQSDFPLSTPELSSAKITELFRKMPWVLVCGGLDDNPERDGCPGMEETKRFLELHEADVLGLLTDANAGHGAFHMSSLGLPKQAIELIEASID